MQIYETRATQFKAQSALLRAKYVRFSMIRLVCFVIAIGLIIFCFTLHLFVGFAAIVAFLPAFAKFVKWHQGIQQAQYHHEELSTLNKRETAALKMDWSSFDPGTGFQDAQHANSIDLDLFGPYSFFQYTCRASTAIGKKKLAEMLQRQATAPVIGERQEAITELRDKLDWRQHFQAYGAAATDELKHVAILKEWLHDPVYVKDNSLLRIAHVVDAALDIISDSLKHNIIFPGNWDYSSLFFLAGF